MRKFFSLIAAVLFAGSMMAEPIVINASDVTTIASGATSGLDVTLQGIHIVWQGAYYNPDGSGSVDLRVYANKSMTLTAESNISKVEIAGYCKAGLTVTADAGTITTGASYASETTKGTLEDPLIVVDEIGATSVTLTCTKQMRAYTIRVTLEEGGVTPPADTYTVAGNDAAIFGEAWNPALAANDMTLANGIYKWEKANLNLTAGTIQFKVVKNHSWDVAYPAQDYEVSIAEDGEYTITITFDPATETVAAEAVKKEALADPTNCAEAAEAALSVSANNELYNNGTVYTIEGYVTGIKTAYSDQYHNISFWMADAADGGEVLQAYRAACASEADAPKVGDKVAVTGSLTKYGTTPEFAQGCTYVITEPYIPVEPEINYYVAGSMGIWGPDEAYRLTPSNNGEYEGEFTFAANDEFKVIGFDGTTVTWFPEGMNNNYVITEAGDYKITFNPAGNVEGWYEGFFNVVKKEAPIVHQYEVAEAIAAGLQDDEEILVRGVITKMEFKGANFAKYGSVNIYVADATDAEGEFEFYNCYSLNADTFRTSIPNYDPTDKTWVQLREVADENGNAIHVGDTVIAFGKYKLFNTTHELNTGCYLVDIKHAPVAPAETITIDIESEVQYIDYVAEAGWWQFMAENDVYSISISNLSTTQAAGTYTVADLDAKFSYVFRKADSLSIAFVEGSFELTEGEDGSRTIEGVMTGDDGNIYNIKLVFVIPTAETTVNVEIPEWGVENAADYYDLTGTIFYGEAADGTYIQFTVLGNNPIGTFTYDDLYLPGIEVAGKYKPIYSMNVTVNATQQMRPIITADILCLNNTLYHVTTTIGQGIEDIDAAVEAIKRIVNGQVVIEKAGKTYNVNGAVIR